MVLSSDYSAMGCCSQPQSESGQTRRNADRPRDQWALRLVPERSTSVRLGRRFALIGSGEVRRSVPKALSGARV
eukprot:31270-Eustigmatos_ZCMA.PRE.1